MNVGTQARIKASIQRCNAIELLAIGALMAQGRMIRLAMHVRMNHRADNPKSIGIHRFDSHDSEISSVAIHSTESIAIHRAIPGRIFKQDPMLVARGTTARRWTTSKRGFANAGVGLGS